MVRRLLSAALIAALALLSWVMPSPEPEVALDDGGLPIPIANDTGVWYCPGADLAADPILSTVLLGGGTSSFSLPVAGEVADSAILTLRGPGMSVFNVGDVLPFHTGPALVEVSTAPSAAGVLFRGADAVAGTACQAAAKEWHLVGGTTGPDRRLSVVLYNPLLESAVADLTLSTEFGFEPLLDFDSVVVAPRDWIEVRLDREIGERASLSLKISTIDGLVIPTFVSRRSTGGAVWPGAGLSSLWEFPASPEGSGTEIAVWNPLQEPVDVVVSLLGMEGVLETQSATLAPGREERFPFATGGGAVVVEASAAIPAALVFESETGHAASAGVARPSTRWLVPVIKSAPGLTGTIHIVNGSEATAEVLIRVVSAEQAAAVTIPAGSALVVPSPGAGVEIESSTPVSVGWRVVGEADLALGLAVRVG